MTAQEINANKKDETYCNKSIPCCGCADMETCTKKKI